MDEEVHGDEQDIIGESQRTGSSEDGMRKRDNAGESSGESASECFG